MSDNELGSIILELRKFTRSEREKKSNTKIDVFFINTIEIACNFTELGVTQNRSIEIGERYWFEGSYHMNFWDSEIEKELFSPLYKEVIKRNWFQ